MKLNSPSSSAKVKKAFFLPFPTAPYVIGVVLSRGKILPLGYSGGKFYIFSSKFKILGNVLSVHQILNNHINREKG